MKIIDGRVKYTRKGLKEKMQKFEAKPEDIKPNL